MRAVLDKINFIELMTIRSSCYSCSQPENKYVNDSFKSTKGSDAVNAEICKVLSD